jgi:hypothetical protein
MSYGEVDNPDGQHPTAPGLYEEGGLDWDPRAPFARNIIYAPQTAGDWATPPSVVGPALDALASLTSVSILDGDFSVNGLMVRLGAGSYTTRSIAVADAKLTIADGDGVAGNPTVGFGSVALADLSDGTDAVIHSEVDDTPVDGETDVPISSNWAFDHKANANAHHSQEHSMASADDHSATVWRMFYSNNTAEVIELAFGAANKILTSQGAAAAPTWEDPATHKDLHDPEDGGDPLDCAAPLELASVQAAGEGSAHTFARSDHAHQIQHSIADNHLVTVDDADAADNDYAKFTADGLEGRSYAEVVSDLGVLQNLLEDTTPELGGELDCGAHSIGFTQQTATGDGATTIDWRLGNKFKLTLDVADETLTFTAPSNPCNLILMILQDNIGNRTITWPATVKWPSGVEVVLSRGADDVDIVSFYYDGSNYYGLSALNFE